MGRRLHALVTVLALGAGIGGCAGALRRSTVGVLKPLPVPRGPRLSGAAPARLRRDALPAVGTSLAVQTRGAALTVTLRAVIDPLRGSGAALPPGTRAVGVIVQIRNAGPAIYDSSATGDFSVVPSSGVVTPVFAARGPCQTPLNDFDRYITAGEDRVGCVVFAVARAAVLDAVRFSPHAQALGRVQWAP